MYLKINPGLWHLLTALACRVYCRSSVGCRLHAVASEWGKARLGIFERIFGEGVGGGLCARLGGVFIRVRF
jgi:hypothetical protein